MSNRRKSMFVSPDTKRSGAFNAVIPITFGIKTTYLSKYFGTQEYSHPERDAHTFVTDVLTEAYGSSRASFIRKIPHFVNRMKFGSGVSLVYTMKTSRGVKYPVIVCCWREFEIVDMEYKPVRKRKSWSYSEINKREVEHVANFFASRLRARLTLSIIDNGVYDLDFDLSA